MPSPTPLAEQELAEANLYFRRFEQAHQTYSLFMGGSIVCAAALPFLVLIYWLLGTESLTQGALTACALLILGFALGYFWRLRSVHLFRQIQSRCLKLQRAGLIVFKRAAFLRNIIDAAPEAPDDVALLDFARLSPWELHDRMI